jgi:hypothetical protein
MARKRTRKQTGAGLGNALVRYLFHESAAGMMLPHDFTPRLTGVDSTARRKTDASASARAVSTPGQLTAWSV